MTTTQEESMMKITKVRYANEVVQVCYEASDDVERRETKVVSSDPPHSSFLEALDELKSYVAEVCDVVPDEIRSLSVKHGEGGRRGFVVSGVAEALYTNSPWVINTPHAKEAVDSGEDVEEGDDAAVLSKELVGLCDKVLTEAQRYLDGHRAQGSLFGQDGEEIGPDDEVPTAIGTRDEQPEPAVV